MNPKLTTTERIDRIVMNKWLALPIFAVLMCIMFLTTFGPVGSFLMDGLDNLIQGHFRRLWKACWWTRARPTG